MEQESALGDKMEPNTCSGHGMHPAPCIELDTMGWTILNTCFEQFVEEKMTQFKLKS